MLRCGCRDRPSAAPLCEAADIRARWRHVQRATSKPSRLSCRQTLRTPSRPRTGDGLCLHHLPDWRHTVSPAAFYAAQVATTSSAIASELVRPGDSIPKRLTRPLSPWLLCPGWRSRAQLDRRVLSWAEFRRSPAQDRLPRHRASSGAPSPAWPPFDRDSPHKSDR